MPPGTEHQLPPERGLALALGVSRRALRRALEVLEAEGRVWRRQGKGTFVGRRPTDLAQPLVHLAARTNPLEVMEARLQLEPGLARLAALRARPEDAGLLRRLVARTAAAADADERELWDSAFHRKIAEIAGNALLVALLDVVDRIRQEPAWRHVRELARTGGRLPLYTAQHEALAKAIGERDPSGAEAAMRRHLLALQESLMGIVAPEQDRAS